MTVSISDAIRTLLRERPGLTARQILDVLPSAKHQLRQMSTKGLLTSRGPRGSLQYFVLTAEEEAARAARFPPRRLLARDTKARQARVTRTAPAAPATYEYTEAERASVEDLSAMGAAGWRVVAGQWEERVYHRDYADDPAGWTVLLERAKSPT